MLTIGNSYRGFRLLERKTVAEINSEAHIFEHEWSGARLLLMANDDDNKVFSVTFRTPPTDDTGVAHILEHSVLCGSEKYPLKEPFVELVKGSLNTFLNAMTFSDKTMYPVASRNAQDFRNLMDVYLDAVFFPRMLSNPEILMQEGWHYELNSADDEPEYKGVVYNEMKGVFSSPHALLENRLMGTLFPDTAYRFESGGDPAAIPDLTQEAFVKFHRDYYHPSNSYIFLYGDMDIEATLSHLNDSYLSRFERKTINSKLEIQQPIPRARVSYPYPILPGESKTDKTMLSIGMVVGEATDAEFVLAFDILTHLLLKTEAAPLKKAIIDAGIGKEVSGQFDSSILQPVFNITVSGANEEDLPNLEKVVEDTLRKMAEQGIDRRLLAASMNRAEFLLREADFAIYPKGLVYNIKCMDSWLHDADPTLHLVYEESLRKIKAGIDQGYFEKLIERYLLDSKHQAAVALVPTEGINEEKAAAMAKKMQAYKASLNEDEIQALVNQTAALKLRQQTPDTPEALRTIPLLKIEDVSPHIEKVPCETRAVGDIPMLYHALFTNKINYMSFMFDVSHITQEDIPWLYLLVELLGKTDTKDYDYDELSTEINLQTGGLNFGVDVYPDYRQCGGFLPKVVARAKTLEDKLPMTLKIIAEICANTSFDNHKRIVELVREIKTGWDNGISNRSLAIVDKRVLSYISGHSMYEEQGQLSFYHFLCDLEQKMLTDAKAASAKLTEMLKAVFKRTNLLVSVAAGEEGWAKFVDAFDAIDILPTDTVEPQQHDFKLQKKNEALLTAGDVQYVAKAGDYRKLGYEYHGSMRVLATVMRYDYLWNKIRVQGGAYGAVARFRRRGDMFFCSYRDPNIETTIDTYNQTAEFLRGFNADEREMTKYILGTISGMDMPLTAALKAEKAIVSHVCALSDDMLQQERQQVLSTTQEDIRALAELVDACMQDNNTCALGNEERLKVTTGIFDNQVTVKK